VANNVLEMKNISKSFGVVKALNNVEFTLKKGECHALMGENGAGKSTLIKILMGVYEKDSGDIFIDGNLVNIQNPSHARECGLAAVYQDVYLASELSVGENFFLGELSQKGNMFINWKKLHETASNILNSINYKIDTKRCLRDLSIASQEMVAIAKAIHQNAKILIFDEPTALLTNDEKIEIFRIIEDLKSLGHSIIYISHRMEEIFEICDRVTIFKDGSYVDTVNTKDTNENKLVSLMVGRSFEHMYNIKDHTQDQIVLDIKNLKSPINKVKDISFNVKKGEIVSLFGLIGAGRTESVRMIFGADPIQSGEVFYYGQKIDFSSPINAIKNKFGFIAEDRKKQSIALTLSVEENINLASYSFESRMGFIQQSLAKKEALSYINRLRIKTPSPEQKIQYLSGGNQQKAVIARWLRTGVQVLIADEPTIGIDIGAKAEIYKLFEELTEQGVSIILISSYLPEIIGLSNRIYVLYDGKCIKEVHKSDFDEELLVSLASGLINV